MSELSREQTWKYFELHALQRMKIFHFYVIICTAIFAAVGVYIGMPNTNMYFVLMLGLLLIIFSLVFWGLDRRTKRFIDISEEILLDFENYSYNVPLIRNEREKYGHNKLRIISYSFLFGAIYILFAIMGLIFFIYAYKEINSGFTELFTLTYKYKPYLNFNFNFNPVLLGILISVFAVVLLSLITKLRTYFRLKKFFGNYYEVTQDNKEHRDRTYRIRFRKRNFLSFDDRLIIEKTSNSKWIAEITINHKNPYQLTGIYNYNDSDYWGHQKLYFNSKKVIIFIVSDFNPNLKGKEFMYSLKKI